MRESIRRSDQPRVVPPIGYLEEFDSSSGHICYREAFSDDVVWFTSLDGDGRLYFYTRDGRSEWSLPDLTPDAAGVGAAVDGAVPDAPGLRRPKRTGQRGRPVDGRLSVLVSGVLSRKLLSGQLPGSGSGSRSATGSKPASAKKWAVRYGVVTENTLLFFPDERRQAMKTQY